MRSVIVGAREPLGDIYARIVTSASTCRRSP